MNNLIKRADALKVLFQMDGTKIDKALAMGEIRSIPSAEKRLGEWVRATGVAPPEFTGRYICSNCGEYALMDMPYGRRQELSRFCPDCGIRMGGVEEYEWEDE